MAPKFIKRLQNNSDQKAVDLAKTLPASRLSWILLQNGADRHKNSLSQKALLLTRAMLA